jgi:ATP adenylyltransferase
VTLDNLWAGWRHDYIQRATERERAVDEGSAEVTCVFCRLAESGPPSLDNLVVWRGQRTFVVLNAYPYGSGHVCALGDLDESEAAEIWMATRDAVTAIEKAYEPNGLNMGANLGRAAGAGIPDHVHLHVLPRWSGDTNFMTSVASTRVMPETLQATWTKLHGAWPRP